MADFFIHIQYFGIVLLFTESAYLLSHWQSKPHSCLFFNCVATLINSVGYLLEMKAATSGEYYIGSLFTDLGKIFIPLSFMFFLFALCDIAVPLILKAAMYIFHIATYLIILSTSQTGLFYSEVTYSTDGPFGHNIYEHGPWYYLYMVVLAAYIGYGIVKLLNFTLHEKNTSAQKRMITISIAIGIECIFFFFSLSGVSEVYDVNNFGNVLGTLVMCFALFRYDLVDPVQIASSYITDELTEPIIITDSEGHVRYANRPARTLFPGIIDNPRDYLKTIDQAITEKTNLEVNERIYTPKSKPLSIVKEKNSGTVYSMIDDTDDIRNAAELIEAKEIAEQERQNAIEASKAKSIFLSSMSHEIRTPMNTIVGMTEILLRDATSESEKRYLGNIQRSGESLLSIINDILDFSKIESGQFTIVNDPYSPHQLLEDLRMIFLTRIGEKSIILDYDIDPKLPKMLMGDGLRLRQIIINLVNNAIKFTEEGMIRIKVRVKFPDPDHVRFYCSVKDTGQGIREEDLDKLFKSFSQVDSIRNHRQEGSGLGLSICKQLVTLMNGDIHASSVYGEGSEFSFNILQEAVLSNVADVLMTDQKKESAFTAPDAHILIVDDNEMNRTVALGLLAPLRMTVDTAKNGLEAVEMVQTGNYDIVFMDHMMPVMDGIEATKAIRALEDERFRELPIIALSANVLKESQVEFRNAGMNGFVPKPIRMNEICKALREYLPADKVIEGAAVQAESTESFISVNLPAPLNRDEALANCGTAELLLKLLGDFYLNADYEITKLNNFLATDNLADYTIEVHALKNNARMIGAMELSRRFYDLEKLGKAANAEAIRILNDDTLAMLSDIKAKLSDFAPVVNEDKHEADSSEIIELLTQMSEAASGFDYDTLSMGLDELHKLMLPEALKDDSETLERLIREVDFEGITQLLSSMTGKLQ